MPNQFSKENNKYIPDADEILQMKPVKIILFIGAGIGALYFLGFIFKVVAGTIIEYKNLSRAINS